jgi:hypothetical protein
MIGQKRGREYARGGVAGAGMSQARGSRLTGGNAIRYHAANRSGAGRDEETPRTMAVTAEAQQTPPRSRLAALRSVLPAPWFLLAALAFVTIVAGQAATSRNYERRLHLIRTPARYLADLYSYPRTELFAAILFVAGGVVLAIATFNVQLDAPLLPPEGATSKRPFTRTRAVLAARIMIIAAAAWIFLNLRLYNHHYRGSLVWVFWFSIVAFALATIVLWWRSSVRLGIQIRWWEVAVVVAALVFFLVVNIRDLNSWKYAAIGDEYSFFDYAKAMENGTLRANIFSQVGVYSQRPIGTSAIQALSMRIFGADSYGWRMTTPIALAAAIPAVYLLGRELFDRQVAVFSTLVFATSHYLTSYSHTVYDNVFALVPFVWSVALAVIGIRRSSAPWMYAAGAVGGIGFYTFPTARMAPVVVLVFLFTLGRRAWQPRLLLPFGGALLVAGLPLFATDRWNAISVARDRTVFGFTDSPNETIQTRILENIPRSLLGFNYNPNPGHFVSGSLLEPIAAVFLVAGLAFALAHVHKPAYRLLVIWFGIDILFAGVLSPYDRVGYDRLHLALPVVALFAGLGLALAARTVSAGLARGRVAPGHVALALFVVMAPAMAYLNLERFLVDSPKVIPTTEERMAIGGIETSPCKDVRKVLAVLREPRPLLKPAIATYAWSNRDVTTRSFSDAIAASDLAAFECIVVVSVPDAATTASVTSFVDRLGSFKFEERQRLARGSPKFQAIVFTPQ